MFISIMKQIILYKGLLENFVYVVSEPLKYCIYTHCTGNQPDCSFLASLSRLATPVVSTIDSEPEQLLKFHQVEEPLV